MKKLILFFWAITNIFWGNRADAGAGILPYVFHDDGIWFLMGFEKVNHLASKQGWNDFGGKDDNGDYLIGNGPMFDSLDFDRFQELDKTKMRNFKGRLYTALREGYEETMGVFNSEPVFTSQFNVKSYLSNTNNDFTLDDQRKKNIVRFVQLIKDNEYLYVTLTGPTKQGTNFKYPMFFINVTSIVPTQSLRDTVYTRMASFHEWGEKNGKDPSFLEKCPFIWIEINDFEVAEKQFTKDGTTMPICTQITNCMNGPDGVSERLKKLKDIYNNLSFSKKYLPPAEQLKINLQGLTASCLSLRGKLDTFSQSLADLKQKLTTAR